MPVSGQAAESGCRAGLFIVLLPYNRDFALHLHVSPPYIPGIFML